MPSPKLAPIELSAEEHRMLQAWLRRRKTSQALALRSQIVLRCARGGTIGEVAAELGVSRDMVSKWEAGSCGTGWMGCLMSGGRGDRG